MEHSTEVFVGIDVSKLLNAIAVAEGERGGEVRYLGEIDASGESMRRFVKKLAARHGRLHFCYEAGPTGYGLYRLVTDLGHSCLVVAPSLIPRKPGDRVKTNRRDALALAKLLRADELTAVWVPAKGTRPCATWSGPVRQQWKACVSTATAIMAATLTMRPPSRTFR